MILRRHPKGLVAAGGATMVATGAVASEAKFDTLCTAASHQTRASICDLIHQSGGIAVIPPKSNRSIKPAFGEHIYVERHHIENLFARFRSILRIDTR